MKYLFAIDAGFTHTGVSVFRVDDGMFKFQYCKTFVTEKNERKTNIRVADDDAERIKIIISGLNSLVDKYLEMPVGIDKNQIMVAVELPHGGAQGARANRTMGMITGAIVSFIVTKGMPAEYITPNDVKMILTGKKTASKETIMKIVRKVLIKYENLLPKTKNEFEHIADSVGVALYIKKKSELFNIFSRG